MSMQICLELLAACILFTSGAAGYYLSKRFKRELAYCPKTATDAKQESFEAADEVAACEEPEPIAAEVAPASSPPSEYSKDDNVAIDTDQQRAPSPLLLPGLDSCTLYTDGERTYEPHGISPTGQLLYTDGQQVFMLACVPIDAVSPAEDSELSEVNEEVSSEADGAACAPEIDEVSNSDAPLPLPTTPAPPLIASKEHSSSGSHQKRKGMGRMKSSQGRPQAKSVCSDMLPPHAQEIPASQDFGKEPSSSARTTRRRPVSQKQQVRMRSRSDSRTCHWPFGKAATLALCMTSALLLLGRVTNSGSGASPATDSELQAITELDQALVVREIAFLESQMSEMLLLTALGEPHRETLRAKVEDIGKLRRSLEKLSSGEVRDIPKKNYDRFMKEVKGLILKGQVVLDGYERNAATDDTCDVEAGVTFLRDALHDDECPAAQ
jgi:hypothetical protein